MKTPEQTPSRCPDCGAEILPGQPKGLCFTCALKSALEPTQIVLSPESLPPTISLAGLKNFGDYELLEEIARGGMGIVYRARQKSLDRIVAVKLLLSGLLSDDDLIRRFKMEAVSAGSLRHPNIVAIHEIGVHDGQHFLVMDFVDGPNLSDLVRDQPLPGERAAAYVKTIAEAIHVAHENGILHRDLKPSNVLIDENDQPRVSDFGLARQIDGDSSLTLSGQMLGSPNYMPPEQAAVLHHKVSCRSDVYGLGAILYHLLTGRPPFQGATITNTIHQVLNNEPAAPRMVNPGVPRDLETICLKCLEKEPEQRYQTAAELAEELERYLEGSPICARPISRPARAVRWSQRHPALASLMAAVVVLIFVGFAGWMVARDKSRKAEIAGRKVSEILNASDLVLLELALKETNAYHADEIVRALEGARDRHLDNPFYWRTLAAVAERTNGLEETVALLSKAIDLAESSVPGSNAGATNVISSIRTESLLKRSKILRRLGRFGEAGLDYRRLKGLALPGDTSGAAFLHPPPDYHYASEIFANFGPTNHEAGLYLSSSGNNHVPAIVDGQECLLFPALPGTNRNYGYFSIDPTFKWFCRSNAIIQVEYLSLGKGRFGLEYDSHPRHRGEGARTVQFQSNSQWRIADFRLTSVRFENSLKEKADFLLWMQSADLFVRRISLVAHNPPDQPHRSELLTPKPPEPWLKALLDTAPTHNAKAAILRTNVSLLLQLARSETNATDANVLLTVLEENLGRTPSDPPHLLARAKVLEKLGRLEEAVQVLSELLSPDSHETFAAWHNDTLQQRFNLLLRMGHYSEAGADNCRRNRLRLRDLETPAHLVDLSPFYNRPMRFLVGSDSETVRQRFLLEVQQHTGIDFDARGYVELYGRDAVEDGSSSRETSFTIPINRSCSRLRILHSASYHLAEVEGKRISSYVMRLADGTRETFPVIYGEDVRTIINDYKPTRRAEVVWTEARSKDGARINNPRIIFMSTWINPRPDVMVRSLDFVSAMTRSSPMLIAITVE